MQKRTRETDKTSPACPYCGFALNFLPDKPGVCPECRQKVYVHHKQRIIDRILLTRDEAAQVARFIRMAKARGLKEKDYHEARITLRNKYSREPDPKEVLDYLENSEPDMDVLMGEMATDAMNADDSMGAGISVDVYEADDAMIEAVKDEISSKGLDDSSYLKSTELPGMGKGDSLMGLKLEESTQPARPAQARESLRPEDKAAKALKKFTQDAIEILKELGMSSGDVPRHQELLRARTGKEPLVVQVIFSMYEESTMKSGGESHDARAKAYLRLARLFHGYGLRCFSIHRQWAKYLLLSFREAGYEEVELMVASSDALANELDGKVMSIEHAMRELPLPDRKLQQKLHEKDAVGWCECDYIPVERDAVDIFVQDAEDASQGFSSFLDDIKGEDSGLIAFDQLND